MPSNTNSDGLDEPREACDQDPLNLSEQSSSEWEDMNDEAGISPQDTFVADQNENSKFSFAVESPVKNVMFSGENPDSGTAVESAALELSTPQQELIILPASPSRNKTENSNLNRSSDGDIQANYSPVAEAAQIEYDLHQTETTPMEGQVTDELSTDEKMNVDTEMDSEAVEPLTVLETPTTDAKSADLVRPAELEEENRTTQSESVQGEVDAQPQAQEQPKIEISAGSLNDDQVPSAEPKETVGESGSNNSEELDTTMAEGGIDNGELRSASGKEDEVLVPSEESTHVAVEEISLEIIKENPMEAAEETSPETMKSTTQGNAEQATSEAVEEPSAAHEGMQVSEDTTEAMDEDMALDIADGLTLGPLSSTVAEDTAEETAQAESAQKDSLMPIDDDTALLKDFLNRAAASKASKVSAIVRRTSLQNRRDSGVIRQALASPRKILEDKDPNSPSPQRDLDNTATLDLSTTLTLNLDEQPVLSATPDPASINLSEDPQASPSRGSRRSSRNRKSRIPPPSSGSQSGQTPKSISLRRADGSEPVVLRKTETQELALVTRTNTRKNKQGAVAVSLRLLKLAKEKTTTTETAVAPKEDEAKDVKSKGVRWDEQLVYFQEASESSILNGTSEAIAEDDGSADELSLPEPSSGTKPKSKSSGKSKGSTPKVRRLRGLGAANGTPGKGLLGPASLLPTEVQEEKEATKPRIPKPSRAKKLPIPSTASTDSALSFTEPDTSKLPLVELAPVGVPVSGPMPAEEKKTTTERKSRLATPRKVKLSGSLTKTAPTVPPAPLAVDGKENQQSRVLVGATPKKVLPVPQVVVPPVVGESGLPPPRRRGTRRM